MKLGVICDGISRDLSHAVDVMDEFDLQYAELQFVGDKEIGDHNAAEVKEIDHLMRDRGKPVSCLSRHVFAGLTTANKPGDKEHTRHMDALKRVMEVAGTLGSPLVRIMTNKKEQILWGHHGAEKWNVAKGAWDASLALIAPAVELARSESVTLVVETGNGTMVNSNYTARKLIDDLSAKDVLKVLTMRSKKGISATYILRMFRLIHHVQPWKFESWEKGNWLISFNPLPMPW